MPFYLQGLKNFFSLKKLKLLKLFVNIFGCRSKIIKMFFKKKREKLREKP